MKEKMKKILFFFNLILLIIASSLQISLFSETITAYINKHNAYIYDYDVQGGKITDNKDIKSISWLKMKDRERLEIDIFDAFSGSESVSPAKRPCYFLVKYEEFPLRLVFYFSGTGKFSAEFPDFSESDFFSDSYFIPYLDDSGYCFAISFKERFEYEIYEKHDPAKIIIDVRERLDEFDRSIERYSLSSDSLLYSEKVAHLEEQLILSEGSAVRIIKAENDHYFVEEGLYDSREEAAEKQKTLKDFRLIIHNRGYFDPNTKK